MKHINMFVRIFLIGGGIFFISFVLIFLLLQKWLPSDFTTRSLESIIIEGIIISILFSVLMFFFTRNRLDKQQNDKK